MIGVTKVFLYYVCSRSKPRSYECFATEKGYFMNRNQKPTPEEEMRQLDFVEQLVTVGRKKDMNTWLVFFVALVVLSFILLFVYGGAPHMAGIILFSWGITFLVGIAAMVKSIQKKQPPSFPKDYKYVKYHEDAQQKNQVIRWVNEEEKRGNLIGEFDTNRSSRVFFFPMYVVIASGPNTVIVPTEQLHWIHHPTHTTNGVVTHYAVSLFTSIKEHIVEITRLEDTRHFIGVLAELYHPMVGFNSDLKKIYRKDKEKFLGIVKQYHRTGNTDFSGVVSTFRLGE